MATAIKKSGTIIDKCSCKHSFQDNLYGLGRRVKNLTSSGKAVCTVCATGK